MNPGPDTVELLTPRILVVDDERQIHASLRLRLGRDYDLVFCFDGPEALARLKRERFDLCFADIHMAQMDGLSFIAAAQELDPHLGYVVISAFDTDENLRRAIPLRVFDFVPKPLPERSGFEARLPAWIDQTRQRRREHERAQQTEAMASDRESARLERDVELVASESARDALLQTASLLTTIQAHLVTVSPTLALRAKNDPSLTALMRSIDAARKTADAAVSITESFFNSAYGNRDSSPARCNEGLRHAIDIALRITRAESANKSIEFTSLDDALIVQGLSGIDFLLMMVPALAVTIASSPPNSTIGVSGEVIPRLELVAKDSRFRGYLWLNRRSALQSRACLLLSATGPGATWSRAQVESWLKGEYAPLEAVTPRGLLTGIRKCHGQIGVSVDSSPERFRLILALPI